jgi:uncharacterized protein (TIGR03435 family)
MKAYGLRADQVTGPDWTETEFYDVVATMPPDTPREQIPLMLQTLLAERFKLVFRRDTKLVQTWVLVIASNGPRLKVARDDSDNLKAFVGDVDARIVGKGTLSSLAYFLSKSVRDPVVDLTGLKGTFEIDLKWPASLAQSSQMPPAVLPADQTQPDASPLVRDSSPPSATPHLVKELERLGLKLERRKLRTEFFKIDDARKEPVDN